MATATNIIISLTMLALYFPVFSGYLMSFVMLVVTGLPYLNRGEANWYQLGSGFFKKVLSPWDWGISVYMCALVFSAVAAGQAQVGGSWSDVCRTLGHFAVKYVLLWYVAKRFVLKRLSCISGLEIAVKSLAVWSSLNFIYCFFQRKFGIDWAHGIGQILPPNRLAYGVYRVSGFTSHPLTLAYSLAVILVACTALAITFQRYKPIFWPSILGIFTSFVTIAISGSRGPLLVAICGFMVASISIWRHKFWALSLMIVSMLIAVAMIPGTSDRFFEILQNGSGGDGRLGDWRVYFYAFNEHPWFGIGFKDFHQAISSYYAALGVDDKIGLAHNIYLQVACESGIFGVVGLLVWFGSWVLAAKRLNRANLRHGLVGILAVACIGGLTQNTARDSGFLFSFTVLTLLLIAASFAAKESESDGTSGRAKDENLKPGPGHENFIKSR